MNFLNKLFCRLVQFSFRIAIPILPYREPKLFSTTEELACKLSKDKINSVLLVTDDFLKSSGATKTLEANLHSAGIRYAIFDKVRPNPTVQNVEDALKLYQSENCQGLIAFGGGSAIDCAKAVGARIAYQKKTLNQMAGPLKVWRIIPLKSTIAT